MLAKREGWRVKEVYTINEAAVILRLHRNTVYLMAQDGRLKSIRAGEKGGKILIPRQAIDKFLKIAD